MISNKVMPQPACYLGQALGSERSAREIHIERGKPYQEVLHMIMAKIKQLGNN